MHAKKFMVIITPLLYTEDEESSIVNQTLILVYDMICFSKIMHLNLKKWIKKLYHFHAKSTPI